MRRIQRLVGCVSLLGSLACGSVPPTTAELARARIADSFDCDPRSVQLDDVRGGASISFYKARGCGQKGVFECEVHGLRTGPFVCERTDGPSRSDWTAGPAPPIQLAPPPPILTPGQ